MAIQVYMKGYEPFIEFTTNVKPTVRSDLPFEEFVQKHPGLRKEAERQREAAKTGTTQYHMGVPYFLALQRGNIRLRDLPIQGEANDTFDGVRRIAIREAKASRDPVFTDC